ncbi:MAG: PaaI family thioesterase [Negativicutes bacterium]|nr:PaaI family thioesterase [Negativicutes bacterium]MDR3591188.1 PaaI family thioesterase [Negativicutes bacterium]
MKKHDETQQCFACGKQNPIGLQLSFHEENDKYLATFTPKAEYQSYDGILHGGIISALLDEVMTRYPFYKYGLNTITARLEIRFRRPTPLGIPLTLTGWIVKVRGKLVDLAGTVSLPDGTVTAEGWARVIDAGVT